MSKYKVQHNVVRPVSTKLESWIGTYPLDELLSNGDSFHIPIAETSDIKKAPYGAARKRGFSLSKVRGVDPERGDGYHFFRVPLKLVNKVVK